MCALATQFPGLSSSQCQQLSLYNVITVTAHTSRLFFRNVSAF